MAAQTQSAADIALAQERLEEACVLASGSARLLDSLSSNRLAKIAVLRLVRAGLDGNLVLDVISKGAAQSWQMENRGHTMVDDEFDFGFAVDWMRKDLGITLDEARSNGARLELTELVDRYYAEVQAQGGNRWDTSSLIARLEPPSRKRGG